MKKYRTITIVLGVCAFAIPASASADPSGGDYSRADAIAAGLEESTQSGGGSDYSSLNAISGPAPDEPTFVSGSPASEDQFDWGDAALGAGVALALVAFGGAALLTVRRHTATASASAT
jgi:hypothetical protein